MILASAVALFLPLAVLAQAEIDYLTTQGKLTQQDFYELVSCRALPGGPCADVPVRWSPEQAADLVVGFAPLPPDYPRRRAGQMSDALDDAITEINRAGAALSLSRAGKGAAHPVTIYVGPSTQGEPIRGTGITDVDGVILGAALVTIWWDDRNHITEAAIVMAADLPMAEMAPVLLEELSQAMGLLTDIRNPVYDGISVFSEDSNMVDRLGPQDIAALRMHYPSK
jgi:hypothetical protein